MRFGGMRTIAIGLAATATLVACSGDDTSSTTSAATGTSSTTTTQAPPAESATVDLGETDLGSVLVDADGMTLYLFEADTDGTSTCYDECAATWPPLIADAPTAGEGVDDGLLGTTERDDGEIQVTYNGHPLYLYAPDEASGDTLGQGIGDVWYVVDAAGEAVE